MQGHLVRFEILKLVYRHDYTPEALIERAKVLEAWVTESMAVEVPNEEDAQAKRGRADKVPGTPITSSGAGKTKR